MVPVQILDQSDNIQAQSENDAPDLSWLPRVAKEVDHLLNGASTVHVEGDANEIIGNRFADGVPLFVRGVFEELLAEVVTEGVCCGKAIVRKFSRG